MSRDASITIGGEHFTFNTHRNGYGYTSLLAVNVKVHCTAEPISEEAKAAWETLPEGTKDQLAQQAWNDVAEAWWDQAEEKARELHLGKIHSEGRCGGWLVLADWAPDQLDALSEDPEANQCQAKHSHGVECFLEPKEHLPGDLFLAPWCQHCGSPRRDHVAGFCPLIPGSRYEPHQFQSDALDTVRRIKAFFDWCELSTSDTYAQDSLDDQLEYLLTESEMWAEEVASAKAAAAQASGQS